MKKKFKPSTLISECRISLNVSESKHIVIGYRPQVEDTNTFEVTSKGITFYTEVRIVDRCSNSYISISHMDLMRKQKYPICLQSVKILKVTDDLFCLSSAESDLLMGLITLKNLALIAAQVIDLHTQMNYATLLLSSQVNRDILNMFDKAEVVKFDSIEDMLGHIDQLDLEGNILRTEMLIKFPDLYLEIFNTVKH